MENWIKIILLRRKTSEGEEEKEIKIYLISIDMPVYLTYH